MLEILRGLSDQHIYINGYCVAQEIHRSLRKMSYRCGPSAMQNDREREWKRERERDSTRSGWLIKSVQIATSPSMETSWLQLRFFSYLQWLKMALCHIKATQNLISSWNLMCFSNNQVSTFFFLQLFNGLGFYLTAPLKGMGPLWWSVVLIKDFICGWLGSRRQTESWRYALLLDDNCFQLRFVRLSFLLLSASCCEGRKRRRERTADTFATTYEGSIFLLFFLKPLLLVISGLGPMTFVPSWNLAEQSAL